MKLDPQAKLLYLITSGQTSLESTPSSPDFAKLLRQIEAAIAAGVDLIQIREKRLTGKVLFELTRTAVQMAQGSSTQILVNDRADIAIGSGASGVHLATNSIKPKVVRANFGEDLLIGVSTHSLPEARSAQAQGADFAVLGPIFETPSKFEYGRPLGLTTLRQVTRELSPFPVLALGGISLNEIHGCFEAGAAGVAGIGMFKDSAQLAGIVERIKERFDD